MPGDGAWHTIRVTPSGTPRRRSSTCASTSSRGPLRHRRITSASRPALPTSAGPMPGTSARAPAGCPWRVSAPTASQGIAAGDRGRAPALAAPNVPIGNRARWRCACAPAGEPCFLVWATDTSPGLHDLPFPLRDDGHFPPTTWRPAAPLPGPAPWSPSGIRPSHTVGDQVEIEVDPPGGGARRRARLSLEPGLKTPSTGWEAVPAVAVRPRRQAGRGTAKSPCPRRTVRHRGKCPSLSSSSRRRSATSSLPTARFRAT